MPYVTRQPMGDCGCGCKWKPAATGGCGGLGADDPIQNITGVAPGTPVSTGSAGLLPFIAAGGLVWWFFLRGRKARRR